MAEVRAYAGVAKGTGTAETVHVEITHHLWLTWAKIARQHLAGVRAARENLLAVRAAGGNWAAAMDAEHADALVTIAACSHALDAIYGALRDKVTLPESGGGTSRHSRIRTVLSRAFRISNGEGKGWQDEFTWLYDLRDAAVHHLEVSRPTVPHPVEGFGSYEISRYCLETSERAMRLLVDVVKLLGTPDKARNDEVRTYSTRMRAAAEEIASP